MQSIKYVIMVEKYLDTCQHRIKFVLTFTKISRNLYCNTTFLLGHLSDQYQKKSDVRLLFCALFMYIHIHTRAAFKGIFAASRLVFAPLQF